MDALIRENAQLVLSTVYLAATLFFAGYAFIYTSFDAATADMRAAADQLGTESVALKAQQKDTKKIEEEVKVQLNKIPVFLGHINQLAKDNKVIINKLVPDARDRLKFGIELFTDYFTFLRFAADLESLNVTIHDLQVRPYDNTKSPPIHFITFSITPTNDAEKLEDVRLIMLGKLVAEKNKRNPFQRFAYSKEEDTVSRRIDLTWVHKLQGIGTINNKKFANINGIDYAVGDDFSKMQVTEVRSDRVFLSKKTDEGDQRFVLKFRKKKKGASS